jgi:aspartate kinase
VIVMKFGGTSVGTPERIRALADVVRARVHQKPVVVVSAFSGITDALVRGAHLALARDAACSRVLASTLERHREAVEALVPPSGERDQLLASVENVLAELRALYSGVYNLGELTPRSLDAIASIGERLSHVIVAAALRARGVAAREVDPRSVVITDDSFGRARPLGQETAAGVDVHLRPLIAAGVVPVLGGYIAATRQGVTTTLGRGGSDWSAALVGALLGADEIQIWTDVDGMMTVDPRLVPAARTLPSVSFEEAAELAYFGAKVLHPETIRPAIERGIPVRILNSMRPDAPGTLIGESVPATPGEPRAIAFKKGISVILIAQPRMLMAYGFVARVFEVFDRHRTPVDLIATSEVSISLTVDDPGRLAAVREELAALGDVQVLDEMAIVSVIGRGFVRHAGLAARVFAAIRDVNVVMISFGASDVNVSFVVAEADAERAVRALHREFFEAATVAPLAASTTDATARVH